MAHRQHHSILSIALCCSILAHALLFVVLSLRGPGVNMPNTNVGEPLRIELVPSLDVPTPMPMETTESITPTSPNDSTSHAPPSSSQPSGPSPITTPWIPADASVKTFPELPLPSETASATGFVELEIELDDKGKPITVTVKKESPPGFFAEWGWEMGMQGSYTPKITTQGPVPSTIRVRLDISGGSVSAP